MSKLYLLTTTLLLCVSCIRAQCWPEGFTHNTRPETMWLSCEPAISPNPDRPASLWLSFDFGASYALNSTTIWNFNEPGYLVLGVTQMALDYSTDGVNWTDWGTFELNLATGTTDYEGESGPDLTGVTARYILLTVIEGGQNTGCAGLSEIRFNIDQMVSIQELADFEQLDAYPNPTAGILNLRLPENKLSNISLYDQRGRLIENRTSAGEFDRMDLSIYPSGIYLLVVTDEEGKLHRRRVTVL
ncbi:MAG: T9SS type A sorting domain-containing protein [Bacteroidota bacterium]